MSKDRGGRKEKKKPKKKVEKQQGFTAIEAILVLVILAILGFVGWYVYHAKNNANGAYDKSQSASTTPKYAAKSTEKKTTPTPAPAKVTISDSLKENTAAAIETQNTAALEGYMASSVTVVIAASEKGGAETAAQAVADLSYLNSGTSPWDFKLTDATLTSFRNGFYGKYFGVDTTIVGQSANKYVVSFGVNTSGKIDSVFMAASADLLTQ